MNNSETAMCALPTNPQLAGDGAYRSVDQSSNPKSYSKHEPLCGGTIPLGEKAHILVVDHMEDFLFPSSLLT